MINQKKNKKHKKKHKKKTMCYIFKQIVEPYTN